MSDRLYYQIGFEQVENGFVLDVYNFSTGDRAKTIHVSPGEALTALRALVEKFDSRLLLPAPTIPEGEIPF